MGIQWADESYKVKEETKWNRPKSQGGRNCDGFEPYPRMLYKAQENPLSHKYEVVMARDVISLDKTTVILDAAQFNQSCQLTVNDEREYQNAKADGWRDTPKLAMEYYEGREQELAVAAAVRAYEDRNMGSAAKAESAEFESRTPEHVAEIPVKKRRGRPPKVHPPAA